MVHGKISDDPYVLIAAALLAESHGAFGTSQWQCGFLKHPFWTGREAMANPYRLRAKRVADYEARLEIQASTPINLEMTPKQPKRPQLESRDARWRLAARLVSLVQLLAVRAH
jgi:hypothetical protein